MKIEQKFSRRVENTVGQRQFVRYEQFLLFPKCFQKTCTADTQKQGSVWERVNRILPGQEIGFVNMKLYLTLKAPFKTVVAFADQDQTTENVQPDL